MLIQLAVSAQRPALPHVWYRQVFNPEELIELAFQCSDSCNSFRAWLGLILGYLARGDINVWSAAVVPAGARF